MVLGLGCLWIAKEAAFAATSLRKSRNDRVGGYFLRATFCEIWLWGLGG